MTAKERHAARLAAFRERREPAARREFAGESPQPWRKRRDDAGGVAARAGGAGEAQPRPRRGAISLASLRKAHPQRGRNPIEPRTTSTALTETTRPEENRTRLKSRSSTTPTPRAPAVSPCCKDSGGRRVSCFAPFTASASSAADGTAAAPAKPRGRRPRFGGRRVLARQGRAARCCVASPSCGEFLA